MEKIYDDILKAKRQKRSLLAILLDPDKIDWENLDTLTSKICDSPATHIFIGGSLVISTKIDELIIKIKKGCQLPIILFPGNPSQISSEADAILFLSLLSGRNPDYLISHHVKAVPILKKTKLEVIPTGYILIESGSDTAVAQVSRTQPMQINDPKLIVETAQAGELLGNKFIYLEAGSGARHAVPSKIIKLVSQNVGIPLIVGGGIKNKNGIKQAYLCGADIVVIGTAFENDIHFFD